MSSSVLRPALTLLGLFTVLTGAIYPVVVTGAAQALFPSEANGSLVEKGDQVLGSDLIGQPFDQPKYFWGRPSATAPHAYNAGASTGTNQGPRSPALKKAVGARIEALKAAGTDTTKPVPADLVTASGSGLDPHISPAAAHYQVARVAKVRGVSEAKVRALVERSVEGRTLGVLGEPRVNVLRLNLALDSGPGA